MGDREQKTSAERFAQHKAGGESQEKSIYDYVVLAYPESDYLICWAGSTGMPWSVSNARIDFEIYPSLGTTVDDYEGTSKYEQYKNMREFLMDEAEKNPTDKNPVFIEAKDRTVADYGYNKLDTYITQGAGYLPELYKAVTKSESSPDYYKQVEFIREKQQATAKGALFIPSGKVTGESKLGTYSSGLAPYSAMDTTKAFKEKQTNDAIAKAKAEWLIKAKEIARSQGYKKKKELNDEYFLSRFIPKNKAGSPIYYTRDEYEKYIVEPTEAQLKEQDALRIERLEYTIPTLDAMDSLLIRFPKAECYFLVRLLDDGKEVELACMYNKALWDKWGIRTGRESGTDNFVIPIDYFAIINFGDSTQLSNYFKPDSRPRRTIANVIRKKLKQGQIEQAVKRGAIADITEVEEDKITYPEGIPGEIQRLKEVAQTERKNVSVNRPEFFPHKKGERESKDIKFKILRNAFATPGLMNPAYGYESSPYRINRRHKEEKTKELYPNLFPEIPEESDNYILWK